MGIFPSSSAFPKPAVTGIRFFFNTSKFASMEISSTLINVVYLLGRREADFPEIRGCSRRGPIMPMARNFPLMGFHILLMCFNCLRRVAEFTTPVSAWSCLPKT